jgi:hypothetical protein
MFCMRHNIEPTDNTRSSADRVTLNFPVTENSLANLIIQCHYQICKQENINIIETNKISTLQLKLTPDV